MKVQNIPLRDIKRQCSNDADDKRNSYSDHFVESLLDDIQNLREDRDYLKKLVREHTSDLAKDAFASPDLTDEARQTAVERLKRLNKRFAYYQVHYAVVDMDELSDKLTSDAMARLKYDRP